MTGTWSVDISIHLSLCNTFLNIPTVKWAETQPHEFKWALNANGFSLSCCYQFIFSIWVLKQQIEAHPCPSTPPSFPPGTKAVKSQGNFLCLCTAHQGHLNTNQTDPTMLHCWQTLVSSLRDLLVF